ncbi:Uncharacterised protein [Salmonella enterica subsp. enterica serovar Typhimurium str. DT104]|nr:Uncharacterised protein [Salmonella enterica subsp. enterica serovar Typhimurium str. DT104]
MEGFLRGGNKKVFGPTNRRTRQIATLLDNRVQHLTIMRGDVFDIAHVFIAPFNLEGTYACIDQRAEVSRLVVIFHR